jgi:hypothetical protein
LNIAIGEVRLLKLVPSASSHHIACTLHHFPLASAPSYIPISYVWGSTDNPATIAVDGHSFLVTRNLYFVLRNLKATASDLAATDVAIDAGGVYYWVDAICIDQHNDDERSQQVRRMRHIYECSSVLINLGEPKAQDAEAIMAIEKLASVKGMWKLKDLVPHWEALTEFFSKPYFSRMWIVQEIIVPRRIDGRLLTSGSKSVTFRNLFKVATFFCQMDLRDLPAEVERWELVAGMRRCCLLGQVLLSWNYCTSEKLFVALLWACRDQKATDPRDKIYALLGLFEKSQLPEVLAEVDGWEGDNRPSNFERTILKADYRASVEDVYTSAVKAVVSATGCLDIICACQGPRGLRRSWTPDWSESWSRTSLLHQNMVLLSEDIGEEDAFHASGALRGQVTFSDDSLFMTAKGICYSTILQAEEPWSSRKVEDELNYLKSCAQIMSTAGGKRCIETYGSYHAAERKYYETLLAVENTNRDFQVDIVGTFGMGKSRAWYERALKEDQFLRRWILVNEGRRIAITYDGKFALVPEHVEMNDIICVLLGCSVPVVLRKIEDHYLFIGECFVSAVMQGELVANLQTLSDFELR